MAFDREVMQIAVATVEELHNRLVKQQRIDNEQLNGARALHILRSIRDNETLKPRFSLILNQAIVLLVSYFGSTVEDIFRYALSASLRGNSSSCLIKEELKVTIAELLDAMGNSEGGVASLFMEKKDLSFQDMQAIQRAFRDFIGVEMGKDSTVNNIILAQACRHVIVHAGGEVTPKLLRQISSAVPRDIKNEMAGYSIVQFSQQEIQAVAQSMLRYLITLVEKTERILISPV
ncbi:MAG: hypothetical protein HZB47_10835 [Nitrosomonadales bacterium]|nr:hypothetical protein [Nitrosomonadales bacterium]